MVFNLANLLLLGTMQVSGMAVVFPIAFGLALVDRRDLELSSEPQANVSCFSLRRDPDADCGRDRSLRHTSHGGRAGGEDGLCGRIPAAPRPRRPPSARWG